MSLFKRKGVSDSSETATRGALAWGRGAGVRVDAFADKLVVVRDGEVEEIPWHLIQNGGWKADSSTLSWQLADGSKHGVTLDDPGLVPEVFRERVGASIIVQQSFDVPGGGRVLIVGRRALGGAAQHDGPVWQAITQGRAQLSDPLTRQFVLDRTAELRTDYEF